MTKRSWFLQRLGVGLYVLSGYDGWKEIRREGKKEGKNLDSVRADDYGQALLVAQNVLMFASVYYLGMPPHTPFRSEQYYGEAVNFFLTKKKVSLLIELVKDAPKEKKLVQRESYWCAITKTLKFHTEKQKKKNGKVTRSGRIVKPESGVPLAHFSVHRGGVRSKSHHQTGRK